MSGTFEQRVVHELIALDSRKAKRDKHWNRYFIGLALQAVDRMLEDIAGGMSESEAFAENFTPAREMHAIARKLGLGLDVEYGRWVALTEAR